MNISSFISIFFPSFYILPLSHNEKRTDASPFSLSSPPQFFQTKKEKTLKRGHECFHFRLFPNSKKQWKKIRIVSFFFLVPFQSQMKQKKKEEWILFQFPLTFFWKTGRKKRGKTSISVSSLIHLKQKKRMKSAYFPAPLLSKSPSIKKKNRTKQRSKLALFSPSTPSSFFLFSS